jgi:hypothetical protein
MEKIKQNWIHLMQSEKIKDFLTILIIILISLISFQLGRISKENPDKGVRVEYKGAGV